MVSAPLLAASLALVITLAALWVNGVASVAPEGSLPVWRGSAASFVVAWLFGHAAIADLAFETGPTLLISAIAIAAIAISPVGRKLATVPVPWLIGIQGAHLPLELLRWRLSAEGALPLTGLEQIHLAGFYGLGALGLAAVPALPRSVLITASLIGLSLGAVTLTLTALEPGILAASPWIWLPSFVSLGLLGMNLVALRRAP